jgi:hypothetical protein
LSVLDLETGERRDRGRGQPRRWVDEETLVVVDPGTGVPESVNVETGERTPAEDSDLGRGLPREESVRRWLLRRESITDDRQDEYPFWIRDFELIDTSGELGPLAFEAYEATLSPDGTLWLATPPEASAQLIEAGPHVETGLVNVFEVEPVSGEARFIASAVASAPNWPLSASATHLAWTEDYCSLDPSGGLGGRTRLYDRASGSITELDRGFWLEFTADGLLGVDEFGPRALIDVTTLEYTFVLPDRAIDVQWSPDYRYATLAFTGGHGGYCG